STRDGQRETLAEYSNLDDTAGHFELQGPFDLRRHRGETVVIGFYLNIPTPHRTSRFYGDDVEIARNASERDEPGSRAAPPAPARHVAVLHVEPALPAPRRHRDRDVVAYELKAAPAHDPRDHGVHLARHDRGAGLPGRQADLVQAAARTGRQPAQVVADLREL